MNKKFNKILSLILVMAFLLPTIVRLEHHHEHFICKAKHEKHLHEHHESCAICDFEFSLFTSDYKKIVVPNENPTDAYICNYCFSPYSTSLKYNFLLRAPPC